MALEENPTDLLLKGFPVVVEITVAWGEMDALKHVNNVVYFRYFENARIAYFEKVKYWELMHKTGIGPILASTKCRFLAPLTFPDRIWVGTRISDLGEDRFVMEYCLVSECLQKIAAEGEALLVSYDYRQNKKAPLPAALKKGIVELENSVKVPASGYSSSHSKV